MRARTRNPALPLLVVTAVLAACSGEGSPEAGDGTAANVVLETLDAAGYTYARLSTPGGEIWVAGPMTTLVPGDTVSPVNLMSMGTFNSATLNRTFDNLYFADAFRAPGSAGVQPHPPFGTGGGTPSPSAEAPVMNESGRGVAKEVFHVSGYTYVEVDVDGETVWLAGPAMEVQRNQVVEWEGGMTMRNFTSQVLERTFDEILFVSTLRAGEATS